MRFGRTVMRLAYSKTERREDFDNVGFVRIRANLGNWK